MNLKKISFCDEQLGFCSAEQNEGQNIKRPKPIELYTFIDPLCPECWAFEPIFKKLHVEYGSYFRVRRLVAGGLRAWNNKLTDLSQIQIKRKQQPQKMPGSYCCEKQHLVDSPYLTALAIKAAEFQGPQAGMKFLRKLRESFFLRKDNITNEEIILNCGKRAHLDFNEFQKDLYSDGAVKALRCDLNTTNEMDVDVVPTFVFFNNNVEDEGIKISGQYPYYVYVDILEEMLGYKPTPAHPLTLEQFLSEYELVGTNEVMTVFNLTEDEALRNLKKLVLQQKVERISIEIGDFWRFRQ